MTIDEISLLLLLLWLSLMFFRESLKLWTFETQLSFQLFVVVVAVALPDFVFNITGP
jgi:hypothetical protein